MKHPPMRALRAAASLCLALFASNAFAQSQTGTAPLSGRVTDDATHLALQGAQVAVSGTALKTTTDRYGDYVFAAVPAGSQHITFSYVGYDDVTLGVNVTAGTPVELDAVFGTDEQAVELEAYEIVGSMVGTARAINQQRASETLQNIVASDEIGRFPDQNAAEALQRIPGLALYRDQGEGRYIIVRGVNYTLNSVTLNGAKLASPEEGDRGIALDVIPADALASVEVTKVPTPDMDGEGLGGKVNIKTKSPFDHEGTRATLNTEGIYSNLTGELGYKINGSFSLTNDDNTLGFIVAPTWQKREFGSYNFEEDGYTKRTSPTDGQNYRVLDAINFRDYEIERERYGVSAALEARPREATLVYLRANYNRFVDREYRNRSVFDFSEGELVEATATSATFEDMRRWRRDVRLRKKDQDLVALAAGGETRLGDWAVDGMLAWSHGHEENPGEASIRFRHNTRDGTFRYTMDGPYSIRLEQLEGGSMDDPTTYTFQRVDYSNDEGNENEFDAGFNARRDFQAANPWTLKFGAQYRAKKKDKEVEAWELEEAPDDFTYANLSGGLSDYPYLAVPRIDGDKASRAFYGNFSAFSGERVFEDSELEDWVSHEDVTAAYLMASTRFGNTTLIAGARVERTAFDTTGKHIDIEAKEVLGYDTVSRSYTSWLPGIYLRHDINNNLVLRASLSTSLARPSFGESASYTGINSDDEEVVQGNPDLEALTATNWDASIEYYLPSLGMVSAGVFYKSIDNFSYEIDIEGGYADLPDYKYTTYENGSDGRIYGLELSYQQQLRMLPAPFDGLGLTANVTIADSEAIYRNHPSRGTEKLPFIGMSDRIGNLALSYEKGGFFARLALNARSEHLREDEPVGGDAYEDRYVDDFAQLDFDARYRLSRHAEVYVEWVNITNEPFRVYFNSPANQGRRLVQFEEYDWSANFGLRWRL